MSLKYQARIMQRILTRVALFLFLLLQACLSYGAGRPFITRWKGEAGKELRFPIVGTYNLVIKRASDGTVLKSEIAVVIPEQAYTYTPAKTEDILLEAGPEGVRYMQMGMGNLAFGSLAPIAWLTYPD